MTERISAAPVVTGRDWRHAVRSRIRRTWAGLRANLPRVLLGLVVGLGISIAIAWVLGPPASGQVRDGLAWVVLTTTITGLATRLCLAGPRQFVNDVVGFPRRIVAIVRDDGSAALAHVLFGFAAGTLITWLLGPALSGALGVGLFIGLGTFLRPILVGAAMVLWRWVAGRVAPANPASAPMEAMTVSFLGSTAAMALALAVPSPGVRLAVGVAAIIVGVLLGGPVAGAMRLRVVLAAIVAAVGGVALIDLAGGFQPIHAVVLIGFGLAVGVLLTWSRPLVRSS